MMMMMIMMMMMMVVMVMAVVVTMMMMMIWFIVGDIVARFILCFLIMPLCSYEKAGRLAKFSVAQSEISARAGDGRTAFSLTQHNFYDEKKMWAGPAWLMGVDATPHPRKVFLSYFPG